MIAPGRRDRMRDRRSGGPLRTCLGCRAVRPQGELVRLVRSPDGRVHPDALRKRVGRGAYLCRLEECLGRALRRQAFGHAFRGMSRMTDEEARRLLAMFEEPGLTSPGGGATRNVEGGS